jgi:hypothetical protein
MIVSFGVDHLGGWRLSYPITRSWVLPDAFLRALAVRAAFPRSAALFAARRWISGLPSGHARSRGAQS